MHTGLKVVEVAHDIQLSIGKYITNSLALKNSFDTWHGRWPWFNDIFELTHYRHKEC